MNKYPLTLILVCSALMAGCSNRDSMALTPKIIKLPEAFYSSDLESIKLMYFTGIGSLNMYSVSYVDSDIVCWPILKRNISDGKIECKMRNKDNLYVCKVECSEIEINIERQTIYLKNGKGNVSITWDKYSDLKFNYESANVIGFPYSRADVGCRTFYTGNGAATADHSSQYP